MDHPPTSTTDRSHQTRHTATEAVVRRVADAEGVSPVDVHTPLAKVIDPDALNTLVSSLTSGPARSESVVEFAYSGYQVTVTGTGDVVVE